MPTALVTGASSGIGADLAREAARDGHDVVLVARRAEPMRKLAAEIATKATVLTADLSRPGTASALVSELEASGVAIDVLINNAGLGPVGPFAENDPARIRETLEVNMVALTELTRLLLPPMIARRRGRVMLVASTAAFQPGPRMAVYFASKAYVLSFGEALAYELRGSGVTVTTLCPGPTTSGFSEAAGNPDTKLLRMKKMSSAKVARIGYKGLKAGRRVVIPGLFNKLSALSGRVAPRGMVLAIANSLNSPR
jgi:hypothetical protein